MYEAYPPEGQIAQQSNLLDIYLDILESGTEGTKMGSCALDIVGPLDGGSRDREVRWRPRLGERCQVSEREMMAALLRGGRESREQARGARQ
jgi:hypothetical protein